MICSTVAPHERDGDVAAQEADMATAVHRLLGTPVRRLRRWMGGGNNRLYRVTVDEHTLALKSYGLLTDPGNDRLAREFAALSFLGRHGPENVPLAVASDPAARLALYGWIDGAPVAREPGGRSATDPLEMVHFILALQNLGKHQEARDIGLAAEACLDTTELLGQIRRRIAALSDVRQEPALETFLSDGLLPTLAGAERRLRILYRAGGLALDEALPLERRILSPSDFGFHNALRRPDGRLAFLDFEYFGWDDPVKLLADTLWHPAYRLAAVEQRCWLDGLSAPLQAADPTLSLRFDALMPLYGLRWCVILLNEFLPDRWQRRLHAGAAADWTDAKTAQLAKAEGWLAEVRRLLALPPEQAVATALPLRLPPLSPSV
jgi:hypothetical protein